MTSELTAELLRQNPVPEMMRMVEERSSDFASPLQMRLTAIALSRVGRTYFDTMLDEYWAPGSIRAEELISATSNEPREVIIGSGYHAAVYAATRVLKGKPRPLVLERSDRVGGTFAMTKAPAFFLNSRNRPGTVGLAGDRRASLNYLPGAPVQAANLSMAEYQTNTDMAYVIRVTLAEYADVVTGIDVTSVTGSDTLTVDTSAGRIKATRVIDARGLGNPTTKSKPDSMIFTFPDFMKRMAGQPWPLRGVRRVAVIGDGDSAKCAVESLIGVGPQSAMTVAALDLVERIDWFAPGLPTTCEDWRRQVRGRYQQIGPSLRPDRFGERRINVFQERAFPIDLPGQPLIDGRGYDMAIVAAGCREDELPGLERSDFRTYRIGSLSQSTYPVATRNTYTGNSSIFRVGPHAYLDFTDAEINSGVAEIDNNRVAMFRTGPKTAALAASLA